MVAAVAKLVSFLGWRYVIIQHKKNRVYRDHPKGVLQGYASIYQMTAIAVLFMPRFTVKRGEEENLSFTPYSVVL